MNLKHIFNEIHYELVRVIAEGGMGFVCEARQLGADRFQKTVAIKLIREEYSAIDAFIDNFIGEARLVADLIHTNIVQTYHLGKIGEQYFIVMEYVQGKPLSHMIAKRPLTSDKIADLGAQIARVWPGLTRGG